MKLVAIDPGLKGGLAIFEQDELDEVRIVAVDPMPVWKTSLIPGKELKKQVDIMALKKIVMQHGCYTMVTEYQTPMPGQSSVSTATSFLNFGLILSLRSLCSIHVVHPRVWKRHFDLGAHKAAAIYHARLIYPALDVNVLDGIAEAVLIGHYWIAKGAANERARADKQRDRDEKRALAKAYKKNGRRRRNKGPDKPPVQSA